MGLTTKEAQLALTKAALPNPNAPRVNIVAAMLFTFPLLLGVIPAVMFNNPIGPILGFIIGLLLAQAPKVAKQWEKAVVLRLGRYVGIRGPGLFWIVPLIETVSSWIDQRIITTNFVAEQTLTSDTVPVNVDAVLFWMVYDPEKAALEVQDYQQAVSWAAQAWGLPLPSGLSRNIAVGSWCRVRLARAPRFS